MGKPKEINVEVEVMHRLNKLIANSVAQDLDRVGTFQEELTLLLNKHNRDTRARTPDYVLSEYLMMCLESFEVAMELRHQHEKKEKSDV